MERKSSILLAFALSFSASAEVYQCADGQYQADPCDENSQPVDLSGVGSVIQRSETTVQSSAVSTATSDKKKEITSYIEKRRISREIAQLESDRRRVIAQRDQRLRNLRESSQYANNNLAGATWQQSLAQEQLAATQEADTLVESIDRQIEQLKKDLVP
jgi:LPS O-antigen subunit length determinant protein (WzzB/FepE family)